MKLRLDVLDLFDGEILSKEESVEILGGVNQKGSGMCFLSCNAGSGDPLIIVDCESPRDVFEDLCNTTDLSNLVCFCT